MKKKLAGLGLLAGALVAAGHAQAQTAEIKVAGRIVPNACQLTISGGGVYDYGTIVSDKVGQDDKTALDAKTQTLLVSCNKATKVALSVRDNSSDNHPFRADTEFSLGKDVSGYYWLTLTNAKGDGYVADILTASPGSNEWAGSNGWTTIMTNGLNGIRRHSFAYLGSSVPRAYNTVTAKLTVLPIIAWYDIALTDENKMDGSATVELEYL
ncbi:DUF1120 domain-containing protein [Burkholderia sp. BE17]|uniref:DUF1120 domain-containing protein n=1 Tax=Burkholderia sp. BE17 TaxID=2656644 RepID=UPI00128D2D8F|nr:DUF1120 domain-containing protein [Burkholderia sp. BE17]MPV68134.1 DUF1120 domain-containing protein [Burkholderia sp. BE17]